MSSPYVIKRSCDDRPPFNSYLEYLEAFRGIEQVYYASMRFYLREMLAPFFSASNQSLMILDVNKNDGSTVSEKRYHVQADPSQQAWDIKRVRAYGYLVPAAVEKADVIQELKKPTPNNGLRLVVAHTGAATLTPPLVDIIGLGLDIEPLYMWKLIRHSPYWPDVSRLKLFGLDLAVPWPNDFQYLERGLAEYRPPGAVCLDGKGEVNLRLINLASATGTSGDHHRQVRHVRCMTEF